MVSEKNIRAVVKSLIDIKKSKLVYLIAHESMVAGLWGNITRYGIEYNAVNHEIVADVIQTVLMDGVDVEYEWSEDQYNSFVKFNPELLSKDYGV